jgi:DNA-directed RNA polymerase specialized sigma24 family protein
MLHVSPTSHPSISNDPPCRKKEWVLTGEAFDKLLTCLAPDRERAGIRYETVRLKLVKFFEWRGCECPEDHADETINRVARRIDEGEVINNLENYFLGVARMVFLENEKRRAKERAAVTHLSQDSQYVMSDDPSDLRLESFNKCMQNLPAETRELLIAYYNVEKCTKIEGRKELADRLGIPLNALRIRIHRIRAKLEQCIADCSKHAAFVLAVKLSYLLGNNLS